MVGQVNALARTTGRQDLSSFTQAAGYVYVKDKFETARLTQMTSETVHPPRVKECPVQIKAELVESHEMPMWEAWQGSSWPWQSRFCAYTPRKAHSQEGGGDRIDADR